MQLEYTTPCQLYSYFRYGYFRKAYFCSCLPKTYYTNAVGLKCWLATKSSFKTPDKLRNLSRVRTNLVFAENVLILSLLELLE